MTHNRYCKIIDGEPVFFETCDSCGKDYELHTNYDGKDYEDFDVSGSGICECGQTVYVDGVYRSYLKELVLKAKTQ
jgi:hypothetical protein